MDQQQAKPGSVGTVLGDDTCFVGKIESRGTLRVDGRIEGEIIAQEAVIVGPSGVIKANVQAASLTISGQVEGNVVATKRIELKPTAVVKGDITTCVGALIIESGARIDGRCSMSDDKLELRRPAAAPATAPSAAPAAAVPPRPVVGMPQTTAPAGAPKN